MKKFIITSKIQSIKTLQYNVEANSLIEAIEIAKKGGVLFEEIGESIDYTTEHEFRGYEDKRKEILIPAGTKGVWIKQNNTAYSARFGAMVEVTDDYYSGDMINIKWLDDKSYNQMDGGYFLSDFTFNI